MEKNIIIGVGNLLFCDDGIGIIAIKYLKENFAYTPELELLDGGTLGFNLAQYFLDYDNVFIIDTISASEETGTIYKIPSNELLGQRSYKKTAHEVEVVQMLEACELYDKKAKVTIFGIVPEDIHNVKIGLSKVLIDKFDVLIQTILEEVKLLNITAIRKNNILLSNVIEELRC